MIKTLNNKLTIDKTFAAKQNIAIIRTDYHDEWNSNLVKYCTETLLANNVPQNNITIVSVPGSWEIPLMAQKLAKSGNYDAIVTFGIIIKGDTHHFDMIANEVARALMQLSLDYSIPIALEILAVYKTEDAVKRAGDNEYNKGIEGATTILSMLQKLS